MPTTTGKPAGAGSGNFKALVAKIRSKGNVRNPAAIAAVAGRKKYGARKMSRMSAAGRSSGRK